MSVSTVITQGYGSFAGVKFVTTFGYLPGAPTPPPVVIAPTGGAADSRRKKYLQWVKERKRKLQAVQLAQKAPIQSQKAAASSQMVQQLDRDASELLEILAYANEAEILRLPQFEEMQRFYLDVKAEQLRQDDLMMQALLQEHLIKMDIILKQKEAREDEELFMLLLH